MAPVKILIVDDEYDLASQLAENLTDEGYQANFITNPEEVLTSLERLSPDIVLMDKLMPQRNGLDVVKDLRSSPDYHGLPIIMLTACKTKEDLLACFENGVDDFIPKPFDFDELKLRIQALYKRSYKTPSRLLRFKNIYMDTLAQTVFVKNKEVSLTLTEYKLLKILLCHENQALERARLCTEALGSQHVITRTVDVHMMSLRKKLKSSSKYIKTIRGVGYKLTDGDMPLSFPEEEAYAS